MEKFEIEVLKRAEIKKPRERFALKSLKTKSLKKHIKIFCGLAETFRFPYKPSSMAITLK